MVTGVRLGDPYAAAADVAQFQARPVWDGGCHSTVTFKRNKYKGGIN
jgi:hypothetical protein